MPVSASVAILRRSSFERTIPLWITCLLALLGSLLAASSAQAEDTPDPLTTEEREWLRNHGPIRYASQRFSPPVEFRASSNVVAGITPDILRQVARNLGFQVEWLLQDRSPREAVLNGEADLAGVWAEVRSRPELFRFTRPYLEVENVFVVRNDSAFRSARDLEGLRVGVVENTAIHEWTKEQKLRMTVVPVGTSREGLLLVSAGRLDGFLELKWLGQRLIVMDGLLNLRVLPERVSTVPRQFIVAATNNVLLQILDKGLGTITPQQRDRVIGTWTKAATLEPVGSVPPWSARMLVGIGAAGLLLILWVAALRRQVARRTRELQASEGHFRALYENTPVPYHSLDSAGRLVEVNTAWLEMLGYSREEVMGRSISDFIDESQRHTWNERFNQLLTGGVRAAGEFKLTTKAGIQVLVAAESRPERDPSTGAVRRMHCVLHNVTEQRQAEKAIHENRALLQAIVDGTEDAVFAKDLQGRYLIFNRSAARMTNKSSEEVLGRDDTAIFPQEDARVIMANDARVMQTGKTCTLDETITFADGKLHELLVVKGPLRDQQGRVIGIFGISRDVTESARITQALRRSEQRLSAAQRIARMGSWELTLRDAAGENSGRLWWSDEVYRIFDLQPGSVPLSRESFMKIVHPDDRPALAARVQEAITTGGSYEFEHRVILGGGVEKVVFEHAEVIRDSSGAVVKLSGTVQDITEKKRAEVNLEEQRKFISAVAGSTPDYIVVFDVISQRAVYRNKSVARDLGFEGNGDDLTAGENVLTLMHPDDTLRFYRHLESLAQAHDQTVLSFEYRLRRKDGTYAWFEARDTVFKRDEQGKVEQVLGIAQDITDRKSAERRIRHLNRVYAVLSEINQVIVRSSNSDQILQESCNIAVEKGGFKLAWIGESAAPEAHLRLVAHAGASKDTVEVLRNLFSASGPGCAFTDAALGTGGHAVCNNIAEDPLAAIWRDEALKRGYRAMSSFGLRVGGEPFGVFNLYSSEAGFFDADELKLLDELAVDISFALEINRREQLRRRVEEEHQRLAIAVEQSAEAILITNASGDILYANPAFERISGFSAKDVLGKNPRILKSGRHPPEFYKAMWSTLTSGNVWSGRLTNRRKDGALTEEEATISPIRDGSGRISNFVAVKRDVTREVAMEAQLRQSQKMEAVGQLAGGVAHDFNNILAALLMWLELLREDAGASAELKNGFSEMEGLVQRATALTRQLLLFGRRQLMQPRPLDLNSLVGNLLKMLGRLIGEHIKLSLEGGRHALWVEADPGMIEQVITNLVVNARDAMPRGGELTLRTSMENTDVQHLQAHPEARAGSFVVLTVKDTGIGMTDEVLKHAFEPFFTTKDVGKGTGLGLSTVYGIVQQHHGWVEVESLPGTGSTFRVYLPAHHPPRPELEPQSARSADPQGQETILVIEDEQAVRQLTVITLQRLGYTVLQAANGQEALQVWDNATRRIDMIISDVVMPGGLSGVEVAEKLRKKCPSLRVILMSGYSDEMIDSGGIAPAGMTFVQKPFSPSALARKVRALLEEPSAA